MSLLLLLSLAFAPQESWTLDLSAYNNPSPQSYQDLCQPDPGPPSGDPLCGSAPDPLQEARCLAKWEARARRIASEHCSAQQEAAHNATPKDWPATVADLRASKADADSNNGNDYQRCRCRSRYVTVYPEALPNLHLLPWDPLVDPTPDLPTGPLDRRALLRRGIWLSPREMVYVHAQAIQERFWLSQHQARLPLGSRWPRSSW